MVLEPFGRWISSQQNQCTHPHNGPAASQLSEVSIQVTAKQTTTHTNKINNATTEPEVSRTPDAHCPGGGGNRAIPMDSKILAECSRWLVMIDDDR